MGFLADSCRCKRYEDWPGSYIPITKINRCAENIADMVRSLAWAYLKFKVVAVLEELLRRKGFTQDIPLLKKITIYSEILKGRVNSIIQIKA